MKFSRAALLLLLSLLLAACQSPESTIATIRKQISEFKSAPDDVKQTAIEKSFVKLEEQIAELERKGDATQSDLFRRQATALQSDFQAARMARALSDAKNAIEGFGNAIKDAGKSFTETLGNLSKETNAP